MEVILLEKVRNLGALGDKVKVTRGYARNCLIPKGMAVYATPANLDKFEKRRAELEKTAAERHDKALERQAKLNSLPAISITMKAGEEGKLFGSVGIRDIAEALTKADAGVEKREIRLTDGALRMVGDYDITIDLESDITATIKLKIVGEG